MYITYYIHINIYIYLYIHKHIDIRFGIRVNSVPSTPVHQPKRPFEPRAAGASPSFFGWHLSCALIPLCRVSPPLLTVFDGLAKDFEFIEVVVFSLVFVQGRVPSALPQTGSAHLFFWD